MSAPQLLGTTKNSAHNPPPPLETLDEAPQGGQSAPLGGHASDLRGGRHLPSSYAEMWASAYEAPKSTVRLWFALAAATLVLLAVYPTLQIIEALGGAISLTVPPLKGPPAARATASSKAWLEDVLNAQKVPSAWTPPLTLDEAQTPPSRPEGKRKRRPPSASASGSGAPLPENLDDADPFYGHLFGAKERYAASSLYSSSGDRVAQGKGHSAGRSNVHGMTLMARLQDRVAGAPAGAPVIAILAKKSHIGDHSLPAGSQIHGTVVGPGNEDTRIYIDFAFARVPGGLNVPLLGTARDVEGRHGIPGRKLLSGAAAGSIGLAAASRAAGAAGKALAGTLGSILGAGVEGATQSGTHKAQRADRDEYVVIAEQGTPLSIYLYSISKE
jgi:hypothetical protein